MLNKAFALLRIDNWLKNVLIFFPYFLSSGPYSLNEIWNLIIVFILFSVFVSSTYIINDLIDLESDKAHPIKKNRPIANGQISKKNAIIIASLLFIISNTITIYIQQNLFVYLFTYFVITLCYSIKLKYLKYFDIFSISVLFCVRLLLGGAVVQLEITNWLLFFIFFTSLGLVSGKKISILINRDIQSLKVKNFLQEKYSEKELINILNTAFLFSLSSYLFWIFFIKFSQLSNFSIILLVFSFFLLSNFFKGYYIKSVNGKSEDVVYALVKDKSHIVSLLMFTFLVVIVLW